MSGEYFDIGMPGFFHNGFELHPGLIQSGSVAAAEQVWRELQVSLNDAACSSIPADLTDFVPQAVGFEWFPYPFALFFVPVMAQK